MVVTFVPVVIASAMILSHSMNARHARHGSSIVSSEFIFERAPFASSHASTIVETDDGLVAAWFGGTREGHQDVGIWVARRDRERWTRPVEVADGRDPEAGSRYPCWNPVLFQPADGPLLLFYKVGPNPREWWGMVTTSTDRGRTWSKPRRLPSGFLGPVRNKPVAFGDRLLCGSSTEHAGWRVHMEWTDGRGDQWEKTGPLEPHAEALDAIQPTILAHGGDRIQILARTRQGVIAEAWSTDRGRTWGPLSATVLPNPNAGIDAVRLHDGRFLLAYNHTTSGRSPLNVATSKDGSLWRPALVLEEQPGEYSYPAVIQARDRLVHITYTWRRERIKHVVLDPAGI
ncbi:MAG: sialidase family protein [Vicinamibacterales bacterium]